MTDPRHPKDMKIKVFADGADLDGIRDMAGNALIEGFTTNPTLMRKAGISDYKGVALDVLKKLDTIGKDLGEFFRETVKMFYDDACAAGYTIPTGD